MNKIFFVGALPPPFGGQSNINEMVFSALELNSTVVKLNTSAGRLDRGVVYHFNRLCRVLVAITRILFSNFDKSTTYVSVDSGLGILYNVFVVCSARLRGHKIFLHYHSFTFIDVYSNLANILVLAAGKNASHIFLCAAMRDRFCAAYSVAGQSFVCSNAKFISKIQNLRSAVVNGSDLFCVGFLSHLSNEKGLDEFIRFLQIAKNRGIPLFGLMAGPPVSETDAAFISAAKESLGDYLVYLGPIYGEEKINFYQKIDLFMFPTRFKVEAQPLVLFEALSAGVPVISYSRGCIPSDLAGPGAFVLDQKADFSETAHELIAEWIKCPEGFSAVRGSAKRLFEILFLESGTEFEKILFEMINK